MTDMIAQTAEVREAHRFDVGGLARYMRDHVEGFSGSVDVRQFRGGQSNPTYYLAAGGREYVLRRKPPGKLLPSAHAVDREYRVITALGKTGFPVPRTFALCEEASVIGTAFYVMDCVHGRIIHDQALPGVTPHERRLIYESFIDVLARLPRADWRALALAHFAPARKYAPPPTGPRCGAVLDGELSTLGHPLADLACNCSWAYRVTRQLDGLADANLV